MTWYEPTCLGISEDYSKFSTALWKANDVIRRIKFGNIWQLQGLSKTWSKRALFLSVFWLDSSLASHPLDTFSSTIVQSVTIEENVMRTCPACQLIIRFCQQNNLHSWWKNLFSIPVDGTSHIFGKTVWRSCYRVREGKPQYLGNQFDTIRWSSKNFLNMRSDEILLCQHRSPRHDTVPPKRSVRAELLMMGWSLLDQAIMPHHSHQYAGCFRISLWNVWHLKFKPRWSCYSDSIDCETNASHLPLLFENCTCVIGQLGTPSRVAMDQPHSLFKFSSTGATWEGFVCRGCGWREALHVAVAPCKAI